MVEMAMAELVHKNRQMKLELAQMPGHRKKAGLKSKDRDKLHSRIGGSSGETGGLASGSGIHGYSQAEGGWEAAGSAGGVRRKLEVRAVAVAAGACALLRAVDAVSLFTCHPLFTRHPTCRLLDGILCLLGVPPLCIALAKPR